MKIAYVGNFQPAWSTENDVRLALTELGHDVLPLQENRVRPADLRRQALASDLLLWTGTWDTAQPLADTLTTFKYLADAGIPSATYHLDVFHGTDRGGRKWWLHPQMHTSLVATADGDHETDWERLGVRHQWLRPAVRHTVTQTRGTVRDEYRCDVAFVGSDGRQYHPEWPYRAELVNKLEEICARRGWTFKNPGGRHSKVDRSQMLDFYASATVVVGDSLCPQREHSQYWSDRAYEAPGRAACMVMPRIDALVNDYEGFLPTYEWGDWADLESQIELFLDDSFLNEHARIEGQRITARDHTYVNRMETLLSWLT